MTANDASRAALAQHARQRSEDVDRRIDKALKDLRRKDQSITVAAVAAQAGVSRKAIYARPEALARIRAHTRLALTPAATDTPPNTIVDALRRQLITKDDEITKLRTTISEQKDTIATLYGLLDQRE